MVPVLLAIIITGAYATDRSMFDIGVAILFGVVGLLMKILNYSRSALLIGLVLGFAVEKNLYLALLLKGPFFFMKPQPAALLILTFGFLAYNIYGIARDRKKAKA